MAGWADAQEALRIERVRSTARAALGTDAEVTGTLVDAVVRGRALLILGAQS